jgi:hypothetical protein
MHLKVFLKLKNPKNSLFWVKKTPTNPKNPKNPKKTQKTQKKPGFFPTLARSTPCSLPAACRRCTISSRISAVSKMALMTIAAAAVAMIIAAKLAVI